MQRITIMPDQVDPNPYQPATRVTFQPADLADLESVRDIGFVHTPEARPHPSAPGRYQIAVGWRRRCAWALYRAGEPMPLDVNDALDDSAMFRHMIVENGDRLNNSAVEKGRLLEQYIGFGHTQAEAGQVFHLTQSGVSNLLRLVNGLPQPVLDLVHSGQLPERHARQLISLSRVKKANVVEIASRVAASNDRDAALDDEMTKFFHLDGDGGGDLQDADFPLDWGPDAQMDIDGQPEVPTACTLCPNYLVHEYNKFCARPECLKAKQHAFAKIEMERLSAKLGIPVAAQGEKVVVLKLNYDTSTTVKNILKRTVKPDCLRLVAKDGKNDSDYYSKNALDSDVILLASTDPNVLKRESEAKEKGKSADASSSASQAKTGKASSAPKETEAQRAKRIEAEEAQKAESREARSAIRKARHDLVWLILHTAEVLADEVQISGGVLLFCCHLTKRYTNAPQYDWDEYKAAVEPLEKKFTNLHNLTLAGQPVCDADESEQRRYILVRKFADAVSGHNSETQFNWPRGLEEIDDVCNEFGLTPPAGWDKPPIHKTESNCHVCGQFTPGPAITGVDKAHGWLSADGVVTCSSKCRATLSAPSKPKTTPVATSAKKPAVKHKPAQKRSRK